MTPTLRRAYAQRLRQAGLRATQPRLLVLHHLARIDKPRTHADVAEALKQKGVDRATVYRNLVDLTEAGLARRSDFGDHVWRFEWIREAAHEGHKHAHFVCRSCGTVECLPDGVVQIRTSTRGPSALLRDGLEVSVTGECDACA